MGAFKRSDCIGVNATASPAGIGFNEILGFYTIHVIHAEASNNVKSAGDGDGILEPERKQPVPVSY